MSQLHRFCHSNSISHVSTHSIFAALAFLTLTIPTGMAQAGTSALENLKKSLQSPEDAVRVDAIKRSRFSKVDAGKAAELLVPLLADKSIPVHQAASAALLKLGKEAGPALAQSLSSKEPRVRRDSLTLLERIGPASATILPRVRALAKDTESDVRLAAIRLLSRSIPVGPDGKEIRDILLVALGDQDWAVRRSAGQAIVKAGVDVVPALVEVAERGPNSSARMEAIHALGTIGKGAKSAIQPLIGVLREPTCRYLHHQALAALANMNPEAGIALAGLLDDRDDGLRVLAINTLTAEQARTARAGLLKMLSDPSEEVRWASAGALARMGPGVIVDVEPLLKDPKAETRAAAINACGAYVAAATLAKFLGDDDDLARQAAVGFLSKRGSEAFPFLIAALRSKSFRAERAAATVLTRMPDRADDVIPVLIEVLLARETQDPRAVARTVLRVNPALGARQLAHQAQTAELIRLLTKAGFLEKAIPEVQELSCLALAERGAGARAALDSLTELLKNPKTEVRVLAAAARAVNAMGPKDAAFRLAPDLIARMVEGTHEQSRTLRDEGMSDLMRVGLKGETFEAIVSMLAMDVDTDGANAWLIHHANASNSWNLAGPNLVRALALFQSRGKLGPHRLSRHAEDAVKEHLWRYLQQPLGNKGLGIQPRLVADVGAVLPIDQLAWVTSAYLALDLLKDDPEYKDRTIQGRTARDFYQDWTPWWREWAKYRAMNGLWSEMGFTNHQTFIWPNLLNMADLASDPIVKQRFRMLLDLTMIEEEQISLQGVRAGVRGKRNEVGANLDPWKDLFFGEEPRRFADANINYRAIYWTTNYKLPPAAILLRKLNRPVSHYAITNHHFHAGAVLAFATPHYILGSQISQPKGSMEFPGTWHRLVFDDMNAVLFPLTQGNRHHVQHRNVYITRFAGINQPAIELTSALTIVEKGDWIFASNGPAFTGVYFEGGFRLERSGRKDMGRQTCDAIFAKTPQSHIVLQAGDVQTHGTFERFQNSLLKAPLKITDVSLLYTGPDAPTIEFFRDTAQPPRIDGTPLPLRSETKTYDSPYLQGAAGQPRITVQVGGYSAVYDFENNSIVEPIRK